MSFAKLELGDPLFLFLLDVLETIIESAHQLGVVEWLVEVRVSPFVQRVDRRVG